MTTQRDSSVLDVAVVGGGVAGCYTAYRLLHDSAGSTVVRDLLAASGRDRLAVTLYESSDRIGGRLWSHRFPEAPNLPVELGGMCFSPLHANVFGLCQKLGLETEPGTQFLDLNLQYLRDHRFSYVDFFPEEGHRPEGYYPGTVPYFLPEGERWKDPLQVMIEAFDRAVPGTKAYLDRLQHLPAKNPCDPGPLLGVIGEFERFLRTARVQETGQHLWEVGFWNLLSEHASHEAYEMATMSIGWYSTTANWSAYDTALGCFIDFSLRQDWTRLKDGYDTLPKELAARFEAAGGTVRTGVRLLGLRLEEHDGEQVVALHLGPPSGSVSWTQRARNVVLALPQRAIQLLDAETFLFREQQFVRDLSKVTAEPASKLFLIFPSPWWKQVPVSGSETGTITAGSSATDLPMRVCYYLGSESVPGSGPGDAPTDGTSLLLATANDSVATAYWDGYLPRSRFGITNRAVGETGKAPGLLTEAPVAMIRDAVGQLAMLHGCDVPEPISGVYTNWSQDPYGGGFHFWNPHECSWKVMPRVRRPVPGVNVFVCGEAFSAKQGWVEGALNTAERVLGTYFGLPRAGWLPDGYDLGA